jgi:hypothetical protein
MFSGSIYFDTCGGRFPAQYATGITVNADGSGTLDGLALNLALTAEGATSWTVGTVSSPLSSTCFIQEDAVADRSDAFASLFVNVTCNNGSGCETQYTGTMSR